MRPRCSRCRRRSGISFWPCCARWADSMDVVPAADTTKLGLGFGFADLATREGLVRLDRVFLDRLALDDASLHARLLVARATPDALATLEESELVVTLASHLDAFVA